MQLQKLFLKHFKTMKLFGIHFNWFAVHKIYRMSLVACSTYISDSITKLCTMSSILLCIVLLHFILSPYKHKTGNIVACFSYVANCGIAMINLMKAMLSEYGCQTNCSSKSELLAYLNTGEEILLVYVPMASVCVWLLGKGLHKCVNKGRKSKLTNDSLVQESNH